MSTSEASRATLSDVIAAVQAADLSPQRRQNMASAVRTVARALGHEPDKIPADPQALGRRLSQVTAEQLGLSAGRWNNIRSLVRAALALVAPVMKGRSTAPMSTAWQALQDAFPNRADRVRLSRLMRWLSARQIGPDVVTLGDLMAFKRELFEDALLKDADKTWAELATTWNRASGRTAGFPALRIEKPSRREVYVLPWSTFPASLKRDVDAWLDRLAGRDFADDGPSRPARPSTLATREYQLRAFSSALVHRGRDPKMLRSLADLVVFDAFNEGLRFFYERRDKQTSSTIHDMASMLKGVARHWAKVAEPDLAKMATVVKRLAVPQGGLTRKNRDRLRPFDDPEKVEVLLGLPARLRDEVDRGRLPGRRAHVRAGLAIAVELLLVAPIRRKNLASIELDKHLLKVGNRWHLVFDDREVKNSQVLEFILPERTVALLEWYLREHRPALVTSEMSALFPGRADGAKRPNTIGTQVTQLISRYSGLTINPHLFRHIGAKLYLDARPGGYEVVRRVLGHKKMSTTTGFYSGAESAAAALHFDEVILGRLAERPGTPARRAKGTRR
ncbi:MAG: site-specific integrase [Burkholderiales bacterium]|nr:site-specific integrase [Burkholderiales bacterium]